ncbi:rta1 domain containing protein [Grosmannia clavigera kw1407]|uniref:Rta1 domain containing protein n=1 Tax=Grosmannia clavigera (strain kw1407 / UAMH 11150) TaxID=655863 RepID=F0XFF0_GROCL|nr:rta1 domain containing protein [Grosmannia clavigera kw1407]EFX03796.1 rta1 domain containing protein [Grosmannia clavigera kw1407]
MWNFCPNIGASAIFLTLFILTTAADLAQVIRFQKTYCWVIVMSGVWQVLSYIFRTARIEAPASFGMYASWFVLILVTPLGTNAFTYDVYGAAQATGSNVSQYDIFKGLHIYMVGVGTQLLCILVCGSFSIKLFTVMWATGDKQSSLCVLFSPSSWLWCSSLSSSPVSMTFSAVSLASTIYFSPQSRILFRIVEYSSGIDSSFPNHEAFHYCLDSLTMFVALVLYKIVHPGRIFRGPETEMPSTWVKWKKWFSINF